MHLIILTTGSVSKDLGVGLKETTILCLGGLRGTATLRSIAKLRLILGP